MGLIFTKYKLKHSSDENVIFIPNSSDYINKLIQVVFIQKVFFWYIALK